MLLTKSYSGFSFLDFWKLVWDPNLKMESNTFLRIPETLVWKPSSPPQHFFFSRKENRILKKRTRNFSLSEIYQKIAVKNRNRFRFADKVKNFRNRSDFSQGRRKKNNLRRNSRSITKQQRIVAIYFEEEERKSISRDPAVSLRLLTRVDVSSIFENSDEIMEPKRNSMIQGFVQSHNRSHYERVSNFDSFYLVEYNHHTPHIPPRVSVKPKTFLTLEEGLKMRMTSDHRSTPMGIRTNIQRTAHGLVKFIVRKILYENNLSHEFFTWEKDEFNNNIIITNNNNNNNNSDDQVAKKTSKNINDFLRVSDFVFVCKEDKQGNLVFCYPLKLKVVTKSSNVLFAKNRNVILGQEKEEEFNYSDSYDNHENKKGVEEELIVEEYDIINFDLQNLFRNNEVTGTTTTTTIKEEIDRRRRSENKWDEFCINCNQRMKKVVDFRRGEDQEVTYEQIINYHNEEIDKKMKCHIISNNNHLVKEENNIPILISKIYPEMNHLLYSSNCLFNPLFLQKTIKMCVRCARTFQELRKERHSLPSLLLSQKQKKKNKSKKYSTRRCQSSKLFSKKRNSTNNVTIFPRYFASTSSSRRRRTLTDTEFFGKRRGGDKQQQQQQRRNTLEITLDPKQMKYIRRISGICSSGRNRRKKKTQKRGVFTRKKMKIFKHDRMTKCRCASNCVFCMREEVKKGSSEREKVIKRYRDEFRFSRINILDSDSYYSSDFAKM